MAISPVGRFLYPMLEGALKTDPDPKLTLRIFEFDTVAKAFTGRLWRYRLEDPGNALGDLQAINDHEFVIIERDGAQGPAAALKVFKIDLSQTDPADFVTKTELLDILDKLTGSSSRFFGGYGVGSATPRARSASTRGTSESPVIRSTAKLRHGSSI